MNAIYIRRRLKVILPDGSGATPITTLAALQKNIESLGFVLGEVSHEPVGDLEHAVAAATRDAKRGDVVLLSPACASYDQYDDFEQRGDQPGGALPSSSQASARADSNLDSASIRGLSPVDSSADR